MKDETARARGRIGGLTRAATAPTSQAITQAARDKHWQNYLDKVTVYSDEADRIRRAELLRKADMTRLSLRAVQVRKLKATLRALEDELNASGLEDCGSDGIDL